MRRARALWDEIRGAINYDLQEATAASFLIPVVDGRLLVGAYQHYSKFDLKRGTNIGPVRRVMFFDPDTIQPVNVASSTARFERAESIPSPGWVRVRIPNSVWEQRLERLFAEYDVLIPAFADGATGHDLQAPARSLLSDLQEMAPGELPYYEAVGPEFFLWLKQVAA